MDGARVWTTAEFADHRIHSTLVALAHLQTIWTSSHSRCFCPFSFLLLDSFPFLSLVTVDSQVVDDNCSEIEQKSGHTAPHNNPVAHHFISLVVVSVVMSSHLLLIADTPKQQQRAATVQDANSNIVLKISTRFCSQNS